MLTASLRDRGALTVARTLQQDALQQFCSRPAARQTAEDGLALQQAAAAAVRFPADGRYLGSWRRGERIAQDGRGLQYSDPANVPAGGNCYACHQLKPQEPAYGNLGPSLLGFGTRHGADAVTLKATWTQLYNPHAVHLCALMPRFGQQGILTEQQLRDVMALLFDPDSPVNQPSQANE